MIKIIDNNFTKLNDVKDFCKRCSFGTRIYSHFLTYGYELGFIDFWVQFSDENCSEITAVYCRLDGDFVACFCNETDFSEASAFLQFQEKSSVTFDRNYAEFLTFDSGDFSCGDILRCKENTLKSSAFSTFAPPLKEYHNLLKLCESDDFYVPPYLNFLSDTTRRMTRNLCTVCGIESNDILVSCAMTVSQTDFSVILGAVATHPDYRKMGYAGCVVTELTDSFCHLDSVYIYTTIERNTRFYEGLGFELCGHWVKYNFGG